MKVLISLSPLCLSGVTMPYVGNAFERCDASHYQRFEDEGKVDEDFSAILVGILS